MLFAGLLRLEELYYFSRTENYTLELDVHRLNDVANSYMILRTLDARNVGRSIHIILDLASDSALEAVLLQVHLLIFFMIVMI